ncbi:uncharacterized protein LOC135835193 [Planococcus citri]|uniref:uncharacterized protein LOC135835193 n=1 Tax=Planococcus citri TaxID=170843 RepID=UPI0031F94CE9
MAGRILRNSCAIIPCMYLIFSLKFLLVNSHGRLIEPPSRASMWRYGFNTPPNFNDHELFCGGLTRQWQVNGGKCGVCGDAWDAPQPRPHEAGGKYGQGVIVRKYKTGAVFTIRVELTANHKGFFEFRLCPNNAPKRVVTQQCLDKYVLRRSKMLIKDEENFHETKFYPGTENKVYEMKYMLPPGLTCSQCVLQWRYIAGNNWGMCPNGTGAIGCGQQEEFRACADVSIHDSSGSTDDRPYQDETTKKTKEEKEKATEESSTPNVNDNEIPDEKLDELSKERTKTKAEAGEYSVYLASIVVFSLLVILMLFALLYFYYYHANETVQKWFSKGGSGLHGANCWNTIKTNIRSCSKHDKQKPDQKTCCDEAQKDPIPPPRTKKLSTGYNGVPENLV